MLREMKSASAIVAGDSRGSARLRTTHASPPPPPVPGGWFGIKALGRNLANGTATFTVDFTGSGEVTLAGKGVKTITRKLATGTTGLAVVPTGSLKSELTRAGKAKVTVIISFKTAGNLWTKTKSFYLRLG